MAIDLTTPAEAISEAATLFNGLIVDAPALPDFPPSPVIDIEVPDALPTDLTEEIVIPTIDELTSGAVAGDGVFDRIMSALNAHIESQYNKGVITQSDVAKVYVAAIETAFPQAVQFLLASQNSFWQAKLVQIQAQNAWLERAKLNAEIQTAKLVAYKAQADAFTAQVNATTAQATYANAKLALVSALQQINSQETTEAVNQAQYDAAYIQTHSTLPGGGTIGGMAEKDLALKSEQITTQQAQQGLLEAQTNVQRAQTHDTNSDTTPVAGIIGVQKDLYNQQIESYEQDGKNKGVKLVADLWTSAKALDDSVQSPGPLAGNLMMAMNTYLNGLGLPNAMVGADTPGTGAPSSDTNWNTPGQQS
jgi:hypothetical protein